MSYYPEPGSRFRNKIKVAVDFLNQASKKELEHTTVVDTSDLAAKVDDLDICKLKTAPVEQTNKIQQKKLEMLIKNSRRYWFSDYCFCFEYKNWRS